MKKRTSLQGLWSSRGAFVLAATGAAVGLGNIWKFPYMAGEHGGSAFVLLYIGCVLFIGLPVMMGEILLGRRGRRNPITTMRFLSEEESGHAKWRAVGWLGVLTGMLILSYYSVIAGWTIDYAWQTLAGVFTHADRALVAARFDALKHSPVEMIGLHTGFMLLTVSVVARGVEKGLERMVTYLMPVLLLLVVVTVVHATTTGHFDEALHYLFSPDFSKLTGPMMLSAMGQAFFSLSLGMGAIMAYGAYLPDRASICSTAITVVLVDTAVALMAGMAIFPVVFSNGINPAEGPALLFHTLPLALGDMPGGRLFGALFFVLLIFAAWTSSIGLLEPAVARLVEKRSLSRGWAALAVGALIWLVGLVPIFAFNLWSDVRVGSLNLFDAMDYLASNILLPLGALLVAVFAGWVMCKGSTADELETGYSFRFRAWNFLIRYVAPLAIVLVFLHAIGIFGHLGAGS